MSSPSHHEPPTSTGSGLSAGASPDLGADASSDVPEIPTSPVPPAVDEARGLLLAITVTTDDVFTRLSASAAIARLSDLTPPYPPVHPAATTLRGQALVDEATSALITAVEHAADTAERARALLALEELHPLPLARTEDTSTPSGAALATDAPGPV